MLSGFPYSFFLRIFAYFISSQTLSKVQCRSHLDAILYAIQIETKKKKKGKEKEAKDLNQNYEKLLRQVLVFWYFGCFFFLFIDFLPFPNEKKDTTSAERKREIFKSKTKRKRRRRSFNNFGQCFEIFLRILLICFCFGLYENFDRSFRNVPSKNEQRHQQKCNEKTRIVFQTLHLEL